MAYVKAKQMEDMENELSQYTDDDYDEDAQYIRETTEYDDEDGDEIIWDGDDYVGDEESYDDDLDYNERLPSDFDDEW